MPPSTFNTQRALSDMEARLVESQKETVHGIKALTESFAAFQITNERRMTIVEERTSTILGHERWFAGILGTNILSFFGFAAYQAAKKLGLVT